MSPKVLAELWETHAAGLHLLARSRCDSAEDCVQEAFVRLSALHTLPDEPIAWLVTVVRNLASSQVRSRNRRRQHEAESGWHRAKWLEANDESNGFPVESDQIQAALMQLSEDCREIVIAHIWNKMTFRQIADAFSMSPASVHRWYEESILQLRQFFAEQDELKTCVVVNERRIKGTDENRIERSER